MHSGTTCVCIHTWGAKGVGNTYFLILEIIILNIRISFSILIFYVRNANHILYYWETDFLILEIKS